jgi:organic hydroperoxide reductase OsmC/OhrA
MKNITENMYQYFSEVEWIDDRRTRVKVKNFEIEVDSPPEFKGPEGMMTPEELFPGILASCVLTTFLEFREKMGITLHKWNAKVKAVLGPSPEKGYRFESIHIHILLKVNPEDREKIPRALELSQKYCFISRAIRGNVEEKIDFEFIE